MIQSTLASPTTITSIQAHESILNIILFTHTMARQQGWKQEASIYPCAKIFLKNQENSAAMFQSQQKHTNIILMTNLALLTWLTYV